MKDSVLIIGAGLTGLLAAYRLQSLGIEVSVVEARDRIGGRIHTVNATHARVEMGATWFNDSHILVKELIEEFQLPYVEQFLTGTSYFQTFSNVPPQEITVPKDSPSYRFTLGTVSLVEAIHAKLKPHTVSLNEQVTRLDFLKQHVEITTSKGARTADRVLTTIPPAVLHGQINFQPTLPKELASVLENTHTWMQDSIKIAFTYAKPFWRERGKSGTIFSNVGPLTEFYDQSNLEQNSFALVGFASGSCTKLSKEQRIQHIEAQLQVVFGKEALTYASYHETLWSHEKFTKSDTQSDAIFPHQNGGHPLFKVPLFDTRLLISGSETSAHHSGYMEGAVFAAERAVSTIQNIKL